MATFLGNGVVWDKENNKVLCRFENREFKTDDKETIEKLLRLGYNGWKDENEKTEQAEDVNHIDESNKMVEEAKEETEETEEKETPKKARR